jgi:hypothetical protein
VGEVHIELQRAVANSSLEKRVPGRRNPVRMRLRRVDPDAFLLRSRGFHWINEVPLNR